MALTTIVQYESRWNAEENIGQIRILVQEDPDWILLPIDSTEEYTAVCHMLTQPPIFFDPHSVSLVHPPRMVQA